MFGARAEFVSETGRRFIRDGVLDAYRVIRRDCAIFVLALTGDEAAKYALQQWVDYQHFETWPPPAAPAKTKEPSK